jgi:diguanylate cyclase (GGDEF)-like protein/PAS domain S-box-containing protein
MTAVPTLRVLLADDAAADAELEIREIKRAGLRVSHRIVESEKDFVRALREFAPDVILSDFSMPQFDGMEALRLARELAPDTPFIFVSGTLGEEYAIRALKNGATDYVVKSNLVRLSAAVERAIADAKLLRERRQTEAELEIARERLQEREAGLRRAQLMAKLAHVITGPDGSFESWSDTLPSLIGMQPASMPRSTRKWLDIMHPEDRAALRAKSIEAGATGKRVDIEYRLRRDAEWIHVRQVIEPLGRQPDAGGTERWFSTLQDITEQKQAEERIKRLNRVYAVLSGINTLIVRVGDRGELYREACRIAVEAGRFRMAWIGVVDQAAGLVKPVASAGEVRDFFESAPLAVIENEPGGHGLAGRAIRGKEAMISNDIRNDPQRLMRKELDERGINSLAVIPLIVGGEAIGVLALYAAEVGAFDNEEMRLLVELAGDVSFALGHIEKGEKLEYLAYYDPLTGLANRSLFLERLQQQVIAASSSQRKLAVSIVDIERFKTLNDAYGRQAGDELLRQLADRIKSAGPDPTRVARIGADHFAIVSTDVENEDAVGRLTEQRLAACLGPAFRFDGRDLRLSARVGIAMYPGDGDHAEALFANAEAALKKAKATGERYLFFTPAMTERIHEKLSLENKLREALEKEEFVLHYQPKVDRQNRGIVGVEALIRWQSPELGLVPPMKFIPLLEETGLILQVGAWALRRAAFDHRAWAEQGLKPPRVAVNVSPIQLRQRDFVRDVERAIMEGIAPTGIDLEITESLIMQDIHATIEKLLLLRKLGLQVAIDDFGTGYSSLSYLARLPVETLKIDRSFIIAMLGDPNTATLVHTMITLAHSFRLKVVAEGVESEEQANMLRLLGCDQMQGYLFSKPLPVEALIPLLRKG